MVSKSRNSCASSERSAPRMVRAALYAGMMTLTQGVDPAPSFCMDSFRKRSRSGLRGWRSIANRDHTRSDVGPAGRDSPTALAILAAVACFRCLSRRELKPDRHKAFLETLRERGKIEALLRECNGALSFSNNARRCHRKRRL